MLERNPNRTKPYKSLARDGEGAKRWRAKKRKALAPVSAKERRKRLDRSQQLDAYFEQFGHTKNVVDIKTGKLVPMRMAPCQACGNDVQRQFANYHHKILKSRGGKDNQTNALALHPACHTVFLHDGLLGMPTSVDGKERIRVAAESGADLTNGKVIRWAPQQLFDLNAVITRWGI